MGTWGVLLCCVSQAGGDFLVIWGSWEPLWEDAEAVGAHPGLGKAMGSTLTCLLTPEKCFGAWGLPLLLRLLTPKPFADTNKAPVCYSIK